MKEQLKTNMDLTANLGYGFGKVKIGHKDHMTPGNEAVVLCNRVIDMDNKANGTTKKHVTLNSSLKKISMCELIVEVHLMKKYGKDVALDISRHNALGQDSINAPVVRKATLEETPGVASPINKSLSEEKRGLIIEEDYAIERKNLLRVLKENTNDKSQVKYEELIHLCPLAIKFRKHKAPDGKFRKSTFIDLYVLLELASTVSTKLRLSIYEAFVTSRLFEYRDNGGVSFKRLNRSLQAVYGDGVRGSTYTVVASKLKSLIKPLNDDWNFATKEQHKERETLALSIITILEHSTVCSTLKDLTNLMESMYESQKSSLT